MKLLGVKTDEYKLKSKLGFSGLLFLLIGVISLFLENTYYQYIDENGYLHESLFLPIGVFSLIIGATLICIVIIKKLLKMVRQTNE